MRTMPENIELQNSCSLWTEDSSRKQKMQVIIEKTVPTRSCMTICLHSRKLLALVNKVEKERALRAIVHYRKPFLQRSYLSVSADWGNFFSGLLVISFVLFHVRVQWVCNEKRKTRRFQYTAHRATSTKEIFLRRNKRRKNLPRNFASNRSTETRSVYPRLSESVNCTSWFLSNVPSWICSLTSFTAKDFAKMSLSTKFRGLFIYGHSRVAKKLSKSKQKVREWPRGLSILFLELRLWKTRPRGSNFETLESCALELPRRFCRYA